MDVDGGSLVYDDSSSIHSEEDMSDLRRGPWTVEEDFTLMNYIDKHGEGRWNSLARCAGLKRTGKSCRLRWLNYLRPDVRRGNITLEEQLLILELHSRWGNRWSKIAQHLPGRTDNEIKNYWRTRVQKHAKQLKCDVNSKQFKDTMRYLWMPRLVERIQAASASAAAATAASSSANVAQFVPAPAGVVEQVMPAASYTPENSCAAASSDSFGTQASDQVAQEYYNNGSDYSVNYNNTTTTQECYYPVNDQVVFGANSLTSPCGYFNHGLDYQALEQSNQSLFDGAGDTTDNLWNVEDIWFLQQLNNNNNM